MNKDQAIEKLREKGCTRNVLTSKPPREYLYVPLKAMPQMGINSWGLVDFLRNHEKMLVLTER